jgi:hypothetical protein
MARATKQVVVTMSKRVCEELFLAVMMDGPRDSHLMNLIGYDIDNQVGRWVTLEMTKKDAEVAHGTAARSFNGGRMTADVYAVIDSVFRKAGWPDCLDAQTPARAGA